ncbi:MAG: hypothetical protein M2R45_03541 [Verrucomicrobia subdivision 3 bacterium]|nr:hypothetical protein [Limisphaerales bacterium]MCS1416482.1 hypothetical protein [Limisphaerales bacterium]
MKNLEQIRAAEAINSAKDLDRAAVNKLPAMILTNGLLATVAFCNPESSSGKNRPAMTKAMERTAKYLATQGLNRAANQGLKEFAEDLSSRDSVHLQRTTEEALAFIGYLRRFAKNNEQ